MCDTCGKDSLPMFYRISDIKVYNAETDLLAINVQGGDICADCAKDLARALGVELLQGERNDAEK